MRYNRIHLSAGIILVVITGVGIGIIYGVYALERAFERIDRLNALWFTSDLVEEYIVVNSGRVPASWEDVEDVYSEVSRGHGNRTIAELRAMVSVDFEQLQRFRQMQSRTTSIPDFLKVDHPEVIKANRRLMDTILAMERSASVVPNMDVGADRTGKPEGKGDSHRQ